MHGFLQLATRADESYLTQRASRRTAPRHAVHRRTCIIAAGAVQPTSCCAAHQLLCPADVAQHIHRQRPGVVLKIDVIVLCVTLL